MHASLPDVFIGRSEQKHLKRLVAEAFRNRERLAPFLSAEVRRAEFRDDLILENRAVPGRQVSYRLDWGAPTPYRTLVYPENLRDAAGEISLLSPIGTALLGLRPGDAMLVFLPESGFHKLYVEDVRPLREPIPGAADKTPSAETGAANMKAAPNNQAPANA